MLEAWLEARQTERSGGKFRVISGKHEVKAWEGADTVYVVRQLRPLGGRPQVSLMNACERGGQVRLIDAFGPEPLFDNSNLESLNQSGTLVGLACGPADGADDRDDAPAEQKPEVVFRQMDRPAFEPAKPPAGLEAVWYLGEFVPGISGYEAHRYARMAFDDGTVTGNFDAVFAGGVEASRQQNPKDWGFWRAQGDHDFQIDWKGDGDFDDYYVTLKTSPGGKDARIDNCYSSSFGYTLPAIGVGSGYTSSFATNSWCFAGNGRFSNDSAVAISGGGSGTASSAGYASTDKTGWYRIDGHVLQLVYDNGREVLTSIGFIDREKDEDDAVLIGGGYYD